VADYITLAKALTGLPTDITTAQQDTVPDLITAASRACDRWCNRFFAATDYDEIRTPTAAPQFTAQADSVQVAYIPLNSVSRISGGRTTAITITNTSTTTNQRATAEIVMTGDPEQQLTSTSLKLIRVASGTSTTSTLTWASYSTVGALATAINALGNGWSATVTGGYSNWATTELVSREGPLGALTPIGATFDVFSYDYQLIDVDRRAGMVYFGRGSQGSVTDSAWVDPILGSDLDLTWGTFRPQVRVGYNAGYSTIPMDIQQACLLIVQSMFANQTTDPRFTEVRLGDKSFKLNQPPTQVPATAQQLLAPYRLRDV